MQCIMSGLHDHFSGLDTPVRLNPSIREFLNILDPQELFYRLELFSHIYVQCNLESCIIMRSLLWLAWQLWFCVWQLEFFFQSVLSMIHAGSSSFSYVVCVFFRSCIRSMPAFASVVTLALASAKALSDTIALYRQCASNSNSTTDRWCYCTYATWRFFPKASLQKDIFGWVCLKPLY